MTCSPEAETRATLFLRMLTLFLSQIAVIPMMSILPGYLTSIGVSPHVTAWASSIGYAALAANALTMRALQPPWDSVMGQAINAGGILASVLAVLFPKEGLLWVAVMAMIGFSDVAGYICKTSGRNGESPQMLKASAPVYFACDMLGTGTARLLGGLLTDLGGMDVILRFGLGAQAVVGGCVCACTALLLRRERKARLIVEAEKHALQRSRSSRRSEFFSRMSMVSETTLQTAMVTSDGSEDANSSGSPSSAMYLMCLLAITLDGLLAGILTTGAMSRFEFKFGSTKTTVGICYIASYVVGATVLLILTASVERQFLRPPTDSMLSMSLTLAFFGVYAIPSFWPAAFGLTICFASEIVTSGTISRLLQDYIPKGGESKAAVLLPLCRYTGLTVGAFVVTVVGVDGEAASQLLWSTLAVYAVGAGVFVSSAASRMRPSSRALIGDHQRQLTSGKEVEATGQA